MHIYSRLAFLLSERLQAFSSRRKALAAIIGLVLVGGIVGIVGIGPTNATPDPFGVRTACSQAARFTGSSLLVTEARLSRSWRPCSPSTPYRSGFALSGEKEWTALHSELDDNRPLDSPGASEHGAWEVTQDGVLVLYQEDSLVSALGSVAFNADFSKMRVGHTIYQSV
jgi:hypothetical protein